VPEWSCVIRPSPGCPDRQDGADVRRTGPPVERGGPGDVLDRHPADGVDDDVVVAAPADGVPGDDVGDVHHRVRGQDAGLLEREEPVADDADGLEGVLPELLVPALVETTVVEDQASLARRQPPVRDSHAGGGGHERAGGEPVRIELRVVSGPGRGGGGVGDDLGTADGLFLGVHDLDRGELGEGLPHPGDE
jgi:hypothetical protein